MTGEGLTPQVRAEIADVVRQEVAAIIAEQNTAMDGCFDELFDAIGKATGAIIDVIAPPRRRR